MVVNYGRLDIRSRSSQTKKQTQTRQNGRRSRVRSSEDDALIFLLDDRWLQCRNDRLLGRVRQVSITRTMVGTRADAPQANVARPKEVLTSSKTFFNPFCVRAEHSTYFTAPSSRASRSPCSGVTGRCFCLASFSST